MQNKKTLLVALVVLLGVASGVGYLVSNTEDLQGRFDHVWGPPPCDPELEECEELEPLPPLEECDPDIEECMDPELLPPLEPLEPMEPCDPDVEECMEPLKDSDMDGLSDENEAMLGTDDMDPDTDGDGLKDGAEVHIEMTDPTDADTDAGGVNDGEEVLNGTDPNDGSDD